MTDLELHRTEPKDAKAPRGRSGLGSLILLVFGLPLAIGGALLQKRDIDAIAEAHKHRTWTLSMETAVGEGIVDIGLTLVYDVGVGLVLCGGLLFLIGVCLPGRLRILHLLSLAGLIAAMYFLKQAHQAAIAS